MHHGGIIGALPFNAGDILGGTEVTMGQKAFDCTYGSDGHFAGSMTRYVSGERMYCLRLCEKSS